MVAKLSVWQLPVPLAGVALAVLSGSGATLGQTFGGGPASGSLGRPAGVNQLGGGGGIATVSRPTSMQNHQVVARNFFVTGGVNLQPGILGANPAVGTVSLPPIFAGSQPVHEDQRAQGVWEEPSTRQTPRAEESQVAQLPNVSERTKVLLRAASSGNPAAQFQIAFAYYQGMGLPKDASEGRRWLIESANRGHPPAVILMSRWVRRGLGSGQQ